MQMVKPQELFQLLQGDNPPVVLDVRESLADGVIVDSVHIPISELAERWMEIATHREIVVVCPRGGGAAALGVEILQGHGVRTVRCLEGGLKAWLAEGLPVMPAAD